jgi:hypothetical protein
MRSTAQWFSRLGMPVSRALFTGTLLVSLSACFGPGDQAGVAERFWDAAREGDEATLRSLALEPEHTNLDFGDDDAEIRSIEIGASEIDGERAEVETWLEAGDDGVTLDLEFQTVLVQNDGAWYVDIDATATHLIGAIVGASMEGLGEAIGEGVGKAMEGVGEAMEGMADEMAEGMEELGRALQEAGQKARERKSGN